MTALILGTTAACGPATPIASPPSNGPTPTVTVPFEMAVTIAITGRFDDQTLALLDEQIARFEKENPDVMVEVVKAPGASATRHDAFAIQLGEGDTTNDIYVLNPTWLAEFQANGWLASLDEHARQQGLKLGDFFPSALEANTIEGQLVALPWAIDGGLLFYRQDLLQKYGYEPPHTWLDLQQTALDVKDREGLPSGFVWQGAARDSLTCNTLESVWSYGGDVLDEHGNVVFDSAATRTALQQMVDWITLGVSPLEVASYEEGATLVAFEGGNAPFMRNSYFAWPRLNQSDSPLAGRVGLAPLPASCLGGLSLSLSPHSLHPEQAFRFMAFLAGYGQQLQMARLGVMPPALETVYHDPQLLREAPFFRDLHTALAATRSRPQSPAYAQISEAIYTEVNKMLLGEQGVAATAANVQQRIEEILTDVSTPGG